MGLNKKNRNLSKCPVLEGAMAEGFSFSFLPNEEILFLDNSVFGTHNARFCNDVSTYKASLHRLKLLRQALVKRNNWLTVPEVIKESKVGIRRIRKDYKRFRGRKKPVFGIIWRERKKLEMLLEQEHVDATANLTENASRKKAELLPLVRGVFLDDVGAEYSAADIELIATTLAYGFDAPVFLFTHDNDLKRAYCECSRILKIPHQTYIVSEILRKSIVSQNCFRLRGG